MAIDPIRIGFGLIDRFTSAVYLSALARALWHCGYGAVQSGDYFNFESCLTPGMARPSSLVTQAPVEVHIRAYITLARMST